MPYREQSCDSVIFAYICNDVFAFQYTSFGHLIYLYMIKLDMIEEIL